MLNIEKERTAGELLNVRERERVIIGILYCTFFPVIGGVQSPQTH